MLLCFVYSYIYICINLVSVAQVMLLCVIGVIGVCLFWGGVFGGGVVVALAQKAILRIIWL